MQHGYAGHKNDSLFGQTERDDVRFHGATQNSTQFITYELLIFGAFRLILLEQG